MDYTHVSLVVCPYYGTPKILDYFQITFYSEKVMTLIDDIFFCSDTWLEEII